MKDGSSAPKALKLKLAHHRDLDSSSNTNCKKESQGKRDDVVIFNDAGIGIDGRRYKW